MPSIKKHTNFFDWFKRLVNIPNCWSTLRNI